MLMGHGDNLVICDVNHPAATIAAKTTYRRLIDLGDCNLPTAAAAILSLLPLDGVVAEPVIRMQVVGDSAGAALIFARMQGVFDRAEGWAVKRQAEERFGFYGAANRAFAIVRTADSGPYGCFILTKGMVNLPELQR